MALHTRRLLLASPLLFAAQSSDDVIWKRFLEWLKTTPPSDNPGNLIGQFQAHLKQAGSSEAEAAGAMPVILAHMKASPDGWQAIFNKIYASKTPGFSTKPNALLVAAVDGRAPGTALDVGMGQGRNSVFLALKGWAVTGFDVSDEGLAIAERNAAAAGVKLNTLKKPNEQFDYGRAQWDLIVITYEPFPLTDSGYVERLLQSLRPRGLVVIESFASDAGAARRKPVDIDPVDLLRAFQPGFRILHFEDVSAVPDWDATKTRVARLVAEKK